jgi:hypothetical protein
MRIILELLHGYNATVTYDYGVMGRFEHTPLVTKGNLDPMSKLVVYVGECQKILELNYGTTKVNECVIVFLGASSNTRSSCWNERDKFGFLLVNFKRLLLPH